MEAANGLRNGKEALATRLVVSDAKHGNCIQPPRKGHTGSRPWSQTQPSPDARSTVKGAAARLRRHELPRAVQPPGGPSTQRTQT